MKNVEKLFKYISDVNKILEHPYFINISLPTNYNFELDETGKMKDLTYAGLAVGMYIPNYDKTTFGKNTMLTHNIYFGPIYSIIDGRALGAFIYDNALLTTLDDVKNNLKIIQTEIMAFILSRCKIN